MKACVLGKDGGIRIEEVPVPEIQENQVLVRITACGMCHSELAEYLSGSPEPKILGHEPVGIIERTGSKVCSLKPGQRVTGIFFGGFAEYAAAEENNLIQVPPRMKDEEAIIEPWSCLVSGINRANIRMGDIVAVIGCGYMGLGDLLLAKLCGASKVVAVDLRREALAQAEKLGADECWQSQKVPKEYLVDQWDCHIFEKGADVVFEATGTQEGIELAGKMVRPHGTLVIVGYHNHGNKRRIDLALWNWKAITVVNAHERRIEQQVDYAQRAMKLIADGRIPAGQLLTHSYTPERIKQAFEDLKERPENYIKGYVKMG